MNTIDFAIVLVYFVVVIALGFWYRRRAARSLEAYFLGGNRLPWPALAMSGAVATFDITGTMWMVSVLTLLGMRSYWNHWMWGVMLPAFGLAYMARWVRRSKVMTGAEWMITRFGSDAGGRVARTAYAFMAVITQASFVGYAFQGIGKFAAVYIPLERLAGPLPFLEDIVTGYKAHCLAVVIMGVATVYVLLGGLFSVVITDVIQTVILSFAALVIAAVAYFQLTPEAVQAAVPKDFTSLLPAWRLERFAGGEHPLYEMFGLLAIAWVLKGFLLNAGGPGQMYDFQRYLAARNPRDAAKLAASWPLFLIPRWAMVAGITLLFLAGFASVSDTEMVMPVVLKEHLPAGLRGLVIAGLLAAFMSTFAGTINSGASYIVRDLWQPFFAKEADERHLIRCSYIATVGLVAGGILIGFQARSITQIWEWMMMALGAGVIIPNVLRWHWWRLNGWGYAAGTLSGIALSLIALFKPDTPAYATFPAVCAGSLAGCVAVSLLTRPTGEEVLASFFQTVRPFGFWGKIRRSVLSLHGEPADKYQGERPGLIVFNTLIAVAGITALYLGPMYLVGHWHVRALYCLAVTAVSVVILYFSWYRFLPDSKDD